MAVYRITTHKRMPDHAGIKPWTNVYYADVADLSTALETGHVIAGIEVSILKEYVNIYKVSAVQPLPEHQPGASEVEDLNGTVTGDFALMLPLFNSIRLVMNDGVGRPSQKYFRCPLQEDEISGGVLIGAFVDDVNANYSGFIIGVGGLCSNTGDPITDVVCQPQVQMRQTDWHRRTRPGYKRGWVPVS